jgi:hypothetical protein
MADHRTKAAETSWRAYADPGRRPLPGRGAVRQVTISTMMSIRMPTPTSSIEFVVMVDPSCL